MNYETFTYIEVEELEHQWAVKLEDCKQEMKPIILKFIYVHNQIGGDIIYIENMLTDTLPERIIDGVNGGISNDFIEVGFWRIKTNNQPD